MLIYHLISKCMYKIVQILLFNLYICVLYNVEMCASVSRESRKHKLRNVNELYYVVEVNTIKVNKWNTFPSLTCIIYLDFSFKIIAMVFEGLNSLLCIFVFTFTRSNHLIEPSLKTVPKLGQNKYWYRTKQMWNHTYFSSRNTIRLELSL